MASVAQPYPLYSRLLSVLTAVVLACSSVSAQQGTAAAAEPTAAALVVGDYAALAKVGSQQTVFVDGDDVHGVFVYDASATTVDGGVVPVVGRRRLIGSEVNVRWWKRDARGRERSDDAAIRAAIDYSLKQGYDYSAAGPRVYIPPGLYEVGPNVFSELELTYQWGLVITSDHYIGTELRLIVPPADIAAGRERWFYENVNGINRLAFTRFENITFSTNAGYGTPKACGSGFSWSAGGHEQGFEFRGCRFDGLLRPLRLGGSLNVSEMRWYNCKFLFSVGPVVTLDNSQAVNIAFRDCDFENIFSDVVRVETGGGSAVLIDGASIICNQDLRKEAYLINVPEGSNNTTGQYTFRNIRVEMRSSKFGMCNLLGTMGISDAYFENSHFTFIREYNTGEPHDAVHVQENKSCTFDDCFFQGTGPSRFRVSSATGSPYVFDNPGRILFNNCSLPDNIHDNIIRERDFGHVELNRCYGSGVGNFNDYTKTVLDKTYYGGGRTASVAQVRAVQIMTLGNELPNRLGNYVYRVLLPPGVTVTELSLDKGVTTSYPYGGEKYQLLFYNADKSKVYAQSKMSDDYGLPLEIKATGLAIRTGTDLASRTIVLDSPVLSSGDGEGQRAGRFAGQRNTVAWVKYY